jgi:hypothetical protein
MSAMLKFITRFCSLACFGTFIFACGNNTVEPTFYWGDLNIEYENEPLSGMPYMRENSFSLATLNLFAAFFDDNGVEVGIWTSIRFHLKRDVLKST